MATLYPVVLPVLAFFAIGADNALGLTLKFLLAKLVYSTSDGAVLFLLGFMAAALLCRHLRLSARWSRGAVPLMLAGILVGYGAHLAATLVYHAEHQVPLDAHVYHWSAGSNSYTALLHSHVGKAAMARFAGWLPGNANYDVGTALAGASHPLLVWAIGLGFLAALAGALLRMPAIQAGYGQRPALTLAYLLAAATAVKSIFDGGVLAYAVLPSLVVLASFVLNRDASAWTSFWRRYGLTVGVPGVAGYASLWIGLSPGSDLPLFGPWLFYLAALATLMTWSWRGSVAWGVRAALIAYLLVNTAFDIGDNLEPLLHKPTPDLRIATFDAAGHWTLHETAPLHDLPIFKIYRALGDDPWKPRKTLLWKRNAAGSSRISVAVRPIDWDAAQGHLASTPSLRIVSLAVAGNEWVVVELAATAATLPPILSYGIGSVLTKNNYYVWLYQADLLFRQAGWPAYVLLPLTLGNSPARAGM